MSEGELKKRIHKAYGELDDGICHEECLPNIDKILDGMWSEIPKTISWHMENPEDMKGDGFVRIPYKEFWDLIEWVLRWKGKQ